jgi:hypothetical protein
MPGDRTASSDLSNDCRGHLSQVLHRGLLTTSLA